MSDQGSLFLRILEWVAVPFSRGFSQPRAQTRVSCIAGRFFTVWAISDTEVLAFPAVSQEHCRPPSLSSSQASALWWSLIPPSSCQRFFLCRAYPSPMCALPFSHSFLLTIDVSVSPHNSSCSVSRNHTFHLCFPEFYNAYYIKNIKVWLGNSLVFQWLELWASSAGDTGSIPGQGAEILQTARCSQKKEWL